MRRGLRALGAVILSVAAVTRCTGRAPAPNVGGPQQLRDLRALSLSLSEAEPLLLALEDRRAFDAPALSAAASSAEAPVRARAALALGRIGDERAAPHLKALLSDPAPDVRGAAAFAAGLLGAPLSPDLAPLLDDPDAGVAARAAWALGFLESPEGQNALVTAIPRASLDRKAAFLRALWRFPTPAAAAAAAPFVADPDPRLRTAALYALARRPQESSLPILTAALSDPDPDTAALSARALGLLGKAESAGPLLAAIDGGRAPVTINAMAALKALLEKNPGAASLAGRRDRLLALAGDANPNLAVPALALLRWLADDREAFRRLWQTASAPQGRRQQVALQSLMASLRGNAVSIADTAIESGDPFLRGAAAEALSFLPEADAAARRAELALDPSVLVRLKVLEGLRTPEEVRGNRALVDRMLADADPGVRAAAIGALGQLEDPSTLALLREAVEASAGDRGPDVAIEAIAAAQRQALLPEARAVVEAAYRHPAVLVSRLARRALVKTFDADPAALPWRVYVTDKTAEDYAALLGQARRPWTVKIETARGVFSLRLAGDAAPMTVMNFLTLSERGYFDGAVIHRVVPNFVVQDGDPTGTGNGGPGYEIRDEINTIPYGAGTVGMALAGPDTGGSQWFVTHAPQPHLDGGYTVFGQAVSGMDVLNRIEQGDRILRVTASAGGA